MVSCICNRKCRIESGHRLWKCQGCVCRLTAPEKANTCDQIFPHLGSWRKAMPIQLNCWNPFHSSTWEKPMKLCRMPAKSLRTGKRTLAPWRAWQDQPVTHVLVVTPGRKLLGSLLLASHQTLILHLHGRSSSQNSVPTKALPSWTLSFAVALYWNLWQFDKSYFLKLQRAKQQSCNPASWHSTLWLMFLSSNNTPDFT